MPPHSHSNIQQLTVRAPARLHMGFIDVSGTLGRRFGSVGVALNEFAIEMQMRRADKVTVSGVQGERAQHYIDRFFTEFELDAGVEVFIKQAIPQHAGLGSGTQMALAVSVGLSQLYGLSGKLDELMPIMGRGNRSGIGIGVFREGGLVVDAGRTPESLIPPVISQLSIPVDWRFIVVLDHSEKGLHGTSEVQAFDALPVFPEAKAAHLCHLLMMRGLPAVLENDLPAFGSVITELQNQVGDYFAEFQGGRFTSQQVEQAVLWLAEQGAVGLGQSSWGPTGFCMVNASVADVLLEEAQSQFADVALEFKIVSVNQTGATIETA